MTLSCKNYLIFQITIPIVTFIVMTLSHIIYPPSFVLKNEILKVAAVFSIYPSIIFSISSAISWKIWKGKNWYNLMPFPREKRKEHVESTLQFVVFQRAPCGMTEIRTRETLLTFTRFPDNFLQS